MTAVQFVTVLRRTGADVLFLALGVTLVTSLIKKTARGRLPAKAFVFLPFLLGVLFCAAYRMLSTWSVLPVTGELSSTLESGFSCGSVATLYYAVYEQFIRGDNTSPVLPLLEGIVPEEKRKEAADALYAERGADDLPARVTEILLLYSDLSEEELSAPAALIAQFLYLLR